MTRSITFKASHVDFVPETGFVGFGDESASHYFWLQPYETTTGYSTNKADIWLERDDQGFGGAGGEWTVELGPTSFTLTVLNAPWLKCDQIAITFVIEPAKYDAIVEILNNVMSGCPNDFKISSARLQT
jgi:hypothetical protein